ncbi:hypothetical protein TELCIR_14482 [Teladorsagia circumcincta]|uniref:Uncharacterized protein n=1 Tax=Teladorsagia circumcincta TaxID=45464 RepID=A0A2G9U112_TELCI|nr:hypothetical protein TELCIR_14482 [Teladorsagia circumcincta]
MLEKSEISSGAAEKYLYGALKAQKDLLGRDQIPHEVRKEKVQELFSSLNSHEHFLTIKEIINPIIKLEGHAAEMSEQEYENYMLRIKDAVKERIRQINRTRSK